MYDLIEIIIRAKKGDKEAFGQIYNLFYKRIYRFIYHLVGGDQELASDLTQNTFLKAWISMPVFDIRKGTLQAYLFTIARNLVIDYRRRKKELSLNLEIAQNLEFHQDLEESIDQKEQQRRLIKALKSLDEDDKEMVILRYFEELSFAEIAKIIRKNEGTIRVQLHRGLKKLKEILDNG